MAPRGSPWLFSSDDSACVVAAKRCCPSLHGGSELAPAAALFKKCLLFLGTMEGSIHSEDKEGGILQGIWCSLEPEAGKGERGMS